MPKEKSWDHSPENGKRGRESVELPVQTESRMPRWRYHQNEYEIIFDLG